MSTSTAAPVVRRLLAATGVLALALSLAGPAALRADASGSAHRAAVTPTVQSPAQLVSTRTPRRVDDWAPAATATITPGVMMYTKGAQCTANFVYTDAAGDVYVGYAAHCAGTGTATDTNGCATDSLPLGTPVTFVSGGSIASGGTKLGSGELAYSSWLTEKTLGTKDAATCEYNDLALVRVSAKDVKKVNPSVPVWGGPTGIDANGTAAGDRVYSYGNSSLRAGISVLSPKLGVSLGDDAADKGWSHPLYTVTPGIPGDSGSGFLSAGGKAVGTLSTVVVTPLPLSNKIGDLSLELAFARAHGGISGLKLALGTEPFTALAG